jgi:hypothetical protein
MTSAPAHDGVWDYKGKVFLEPAKIEEWCAPYPWWGGVRTGEV